MNQSEFENRKTIFHEVYYRILEEEFKGKEQHETPRFDLDWTSNIGKIPLDLIANLSPNALNEIIKEYTKEFPSSERRIQ